MDPSRNQHGEDAIAARDRPLNDMAVVRRTRNDRDTPREFLELVHTDLAAYGDHPIAAVQRMLHHVPPELARGTDDADPRPGRAIRFAAVLRCFRGLSANWNRCTPECLLCLHASTFPRKPSRYKQAIPANPPGANPVPTQPMPTGQGQIRSRVSEYVPVG